MGIKSTLVNQFRKPAGWLGRLILSDMNRCHSKLTDWGLEHISIEKHYTILDVGCGAGRTVYKFAAIAPEGKVYGVDHSEESAAASRRTNKQWIERGRVEIRRASVAQLPFPDNSIDLATAVETHFYWLADMQEVIRVLKPGGTFLIVAEVLQKNVDLMATTTLNYARLSVDEHRELFSATGYTEVQVFEEYDQGWICAIGRKPAANEHLPLDYTPQWIAPGIVTSADIHRDQGFVAAQPPTL